jgi:hypothetical protein
MIAVYATSDYENGTYVEKIIFSDNGKMVSIKPVTDDDLKASGISRISPKIKTSISSLARYPATSSISPITKSCLYGKFRKES